MSTLPCLLRKLPGLPIDGQLKFADHGIFRGTAHHSIKVFNVDGRRLSGFEPYSGFLHQHRSAPISSTCFHPHRMMLACSALNDNHVNVLICETREHKDEDTLLPGSF